MNIAHGLNTTYMQENKTQIAGDGVLKKFCQRSGCKEQVPIGDKYCGKHKQSQDDNRKAYDKSIRYGRDKQYHDFYTSSEWLLTTEHINNKFHGLCLYSYFVDKKIVKSDAVHHIRPLKLFWDKRLDVNNLIPLSHKAHTTIHSLYNKGKENETVELLLSLLKKWDEMNKAVMS